MTTAAYAVVGMTCSHCVTAVTTEIRALDGVTDVVVQLAVNAASTVTVTSDAPLADSVVAAAVAEAGYTLAGAAAT